MIVKLDHDVLFATRQNAAKAELGMFNLGALREGGHREHGGAQRDGEAAVQRLEQASAIAPIFPERFIGRPMAQQLIFGTSALTSR